MDREIAKIKFYFSEKNNLDKNFKITEIKKE